MAVIPKEGGTHDKSPTITVETNTNLPPGSQIEILRNGVSVGFATKVSNVANVYELTDVNVPLGREVYSARVMYQGALVTTEDYPIIIEDDHVLSITILGSIPVGTKFSSTCHVENCASGYFGVYVVLDSTMPTGTYCIFDKDNQPVDFGSGANINHIQGAVTNRFFDSGKAVPDDWNFNGTPTATDMWSLAPGSIWTLGRVDWQSSYTPSATDTLVGVNNEILVIAQTLIVTCAA